ncbi:MAG: AAA family ATPase, partial [Actinomycetota bacterium]|nr:AAA family ATPase [Actinomycetota bacterium]
TVVGAALAARAAAELQAGSAIPSTTLARLLTDMARPEAALPLGSAIVIDEAGMVGTRDLHRLVTLAAAQQARVVLVGDPRQLPEIDAGGSFARLATQLPTHTLAANRRQAERWERDTLDLLRDRQPGPALARYGDHGRITIADTAVELRDQMVADWHHNHSQGQSTVMLALRRGDVADLNHRAQTLRVAAGELDPARALHVDEQRLLVGDEIVCGRNDRRAGLINGTRLTITSIEASTGSLTGRDPDGLAVNVPAGYLAEGHVRLGYGLTIHKAQGATFDRALLLGDDRLFAEAGYVGLSRGRQANQLYVVAGNEPLHPGSELPGVGLIDHVCAALGVSRAQALSTAQVTGHIPDGPLSALVAERDRLAGRLIASMPPPPDLGRLSAGPAIADTVAGDIAGRDRWSMSHRRDGERLARLTAAVDRRVSHLGVAALVDPPDHLTRLLGRPPENPFERRGWAESAAMVEAWREVSGQSPDRSSRHLLAEPGRDRREHQWWAQATRALDRYQARHHQLTGRATAFGDRHARRADDGLDRSWQPDQERGLSR